MSNRPSICWKCVHRENCKLFINDPEAEVIDCGRFLMKDADKAIMQAMYKHFNIPIDIPEVKEKLDEAEDSYRHFMKRTFGINIDESEEKE